MAEIGYLLGIDLGTSSVKVNLVEPERGIVGLAGKAYPIDTPFSDWAEQDPNAWWEATCQAIRQVFLECDIDPRQVRGVGLSGQMHGLVILDENGQVIRPAIIWPDKRSKKECRLIPSLIDPDLLYQITGMPIATGFYGTSLLLLREHEPESYTRARIALLPKDYIRYKLTGELATDVTDASGTLLQDIRQRIWSEQIVESMGLRRSLLPLILESSEIAGYVTKKACEVTGLPAGTIVAAGGGDQAMAAVGTGAITRGIVASNLGSGGQLITSIHHPITDPGHRIHTMCHALKDSWLLMGAILAAGLSLRWFKENFGLGEDLINKINNINPYELITLEAKGSEPGSAGLIFLPYMAGERTPYMDPDATGCFFGLRLTHTRAHVIRAIMEGVAFAMKDSLEIFRELEIPITTIVSSGGGAKSKLWRQILADVYQEPIISLAHDEHSSYGAALIAGLACGVFTTINEFVATKTAYREISYPIKENIPIYERQYALYRSLYPALKSLFPRTYDDNS